MGQLQLLSKSDYKKLLVATEVYRQQLSMYEKKEQTRDNRAWCKERGIRMSGPPLGSYALLTSFLTKARRLKPSWPRGDRDQE